MPPALVQRFESLPVEAQRSADVRWLLHLACAMLIILMLPLIWAPWFYSHTVLALPEATSLDLDISLTGCDLLALPQDSKEARLSYWRFWGSGSLEVVNRTLRVRAVTRRKVLMMRCTLVLYLPDLSQGSQEYHYDSAKISIQPDHAATDRGGCSNTGQMLSVSMTSLHLREMELHVGTVARSELRDLRARQVKAQLTGGSLVLHHGRVQQASIRAKDAMVHVTHPSIEVRWDNNATFQQVALAAPTVKAEKTWYRLISEHENPLQLDLGAVGSRIYVQAMSEPTNKLLLTEQPQKCEPLQVVRGGGHAEEAMLLLPEAKKLLSGLHGWLADAAAKKKHRWIIYLHLLAPNAPLGMLQLISSPVYQAISLSSASLISGGMLQPHIERIVAPVGGMDWLFPEDPCSTETDQERSIRFATSLVAAVTAEVDTAKMNLTAARWLWDAKGDAVYSLQEVEDHGRSRWRALPVTVQDVWPFLTAASITLTLSLGAGICVVLLIVLRVIPSLRKELQRNQIMNTASYRLDSKEGSSWVVSSSVIHWPIRGVLLRWGPRRNALQFQSMSFTARLWPDGKPMEGYKGMVRSKRIPVSKLPSYPDLPDQTCFLFVADCRDVDSMRNFKCPDPFNAKLNSLGVMQADEEQLPLRSGRPYQFQVTAYGEHGEVLGVSAWSMPCTIEQQRRFTELPLLLWQGLGGLLPSSTFEYFLQEHCVVLPKEPTMVIKLKKIRLSVLANAHELSGTASNGESLKQQILLYFSTGRDLKATEPVKLYSEEERQRGQMKRPMSQVFQSDRAHHEKVVVLEPFATEIALDVGNDLSRKLTIEVSLVSKDGEEETVAKWEHSWSHLLDLLRHCRSEELTDEVVLRAGLIPVAFLSAKFEICNTMLASTSRPAMKRRGSPEIFEQIRRGSSFFWGETVKLEWNVPADAEAEQLEIAAVTRKLALDKLALGQVSEAEGRTDVSILQSVDLRAGAATLELCPEGEGMMSCYLQAKSLRSREIVACSGQFLVGRPILLQDLELCYGGFCARNGILMERMDAGLEMAKVYTVERSFNVISGYRAPLPVPLEVEAVAAAGRREVFIENQSSCAIVPEAPVRLQTPNGQEKAVTSQATMETPLLASEEPVEERLPKVIVPHRQALKIPTNVFWRRDSDWIRDPLLWYRLMPFESLHGPVGQGLRALLLTCLFFGQIAAQTLPVALLVATAVCHDGVHAAVRADLLRRDTPHFFLLDFIVAPSFFRFFSLDFSMQLLQGSAVVYILLVGSTIAYCMVLRSMPELKPAEPFFCRADDLISCVSCVLLIAFVLIATNTLMWIVLGSLLRPAELIPYAIMVGAAVTLSQSMLTKFKGMQTFCTSKMTGLLDKALFAIFKVMAKGQYSFEEERKAFEKLQEEVWKKLPTMEAPEKKQMVSMVKKGRSDDEAHDFLSEIQLDGKDSRRCSGSKEKREKQALEEKEKQVKGLAKSLSLHSDTVRLIMSSFESFVVMKRLRNDSAANSNSSVETMASLMAAARKDCLFGHFLSQADDSKEDTPETEPRVLSLLSHLQNEEMETMDSILARCLSLCLDWARISKEADAFWTRSLHGVVLDAIERQLSPVIQSSAASHVVLAAYQLGYVYFEQRYKSSPLDIFVDCGIVDKEEIQLPQVQYVLNATLDAHLNRSHPNARALIQAVRSLILPSEKTADMTGIQGKAYFCFATLVAVLKDLGWSKDELQSQYLLEKWKELTEGLCLFEYRTTKEVAALVLRFSRGGLWKAAAKCLLLKIGLGGYAGCQGGAAEAGKLAKELQGGDVLNIRMVKDKCRWPDDVKEIWKEKSLPAGSGESPRFLPVASILDFLEALVYVPEEPGSEVRSLPLLVPFADAMEDLAWHRGPDRSIWHLRPAGARKLRGLWLELVLQLFDRMECVPSDLDLFFQCKEWVPPESRASSPVVGQASQATDSQTLSFMVRPATLKAWLKRVYLATLKECTFHQFQVIVQNMLKCTIPEEALWEEVFEKCPKIKDDDKGELRAVADLGAALFAYTNHGLWSEALGQVARRVLPTGPIREYTLLNLEDAFAKEDSEKRGVLDARKALELIQVLATPGLTCSDLSHMLEQELGLHVPRPELQRYFAMMDINNDGVLQRDEFVQMVRFLMLDYYPHHILKHLNLTMRQIVAFMLVVLMAIGLIFFLVTLVVGLFQAGAELDSMLHGGFVGSFGVIGKRLSDQGIGFEDTMQNLEVKLEAMLGGALVLVLGLSREMEQVFRGLLAEVEAAI